MPDEQQRGEQLRRLPSYAGVAGGQRRQPQQHQAAHDLALHLRPRARPRASGSASAGAARAARWGCGGSRGRRTPSRSRTPASGAAASSSTTARARSIATSASVGQLHRRPAAGHRHHVVEGHRAHAHLHGLHAAIQLPRPSRDPPTAGDVPASADRRHVDLDTLTPLRGRAAPPARLLSNVPGRPGAHGGSNPCRRGSSGSS